MALLESCRGRPRARAPRRQAARDRRLDLRPDAAREPGDRRAHDAQAFAPPAGDRRAVAEHGDGRRAAAAEAGARRRRRRPGRRGRSGWCTPTSGMEFSLAAGAETTIGRKDPVTGIYPDIDLSPVDGQRSISRRHSKIYRRGEKLFVAEEIGTMNGTFINGDRLETGVPVEISDGDEVRFGLIERGAASSRPRRRPSPRGSRRAPAGDRVERRDAPRPARSVGLELRHVTLEALSGVGAGPAGSARRRRSRDGRRSARPPAAALRGPAPTPSHRRRGALRRALARRRRRGDLPRAPDR